MEPDPTPSPEGAEIDWLHLLEVGMSVGMLVWYFYECHAGFRMWVNGLVGRVTGEQRRRRAREREVREMAWEAWLVVQAMNEGGGEGLDRRLGIA